MAPEVATEVVATVRRLKERAGFPVAKALSILELPRATYFRWQAQGGKTVPQRTYVPKSHYLLPEEREAILAYKRAHPKVGYRRLAFMMLDEGVAAVSPGTVYEVLYKAGLSSRWTRTGGTPSKKGFVQPERPHEQWHIDISYLNILGTHYFFIAVLDGYSRAIVHHEVRQDMETRDVQIVVERALEKLPPGTSKPRLISDNGPQFVSAEFKAFLREKDISHSRSRPNHPQSNGKLQRFNGTLKEECIRVSPLISLEQARELIAEYVQEYNTRRPHSSLNYLTPQDYLQGKEHIERRLKERRQKLEEARQARKAAYYEEIKRQRESKTAS
ncbi:MAG: IS3 family transposase [Candidatus Methanomethyliaceae archaeon]